MEFKTQGLFFELWEQIWVRFHSVMLPPAEPYMIITIPSVIIHMSPSREWRHRSFDLSKNEVMRKLSSESTAGGDFATESALSLSHTWVKSEAFNKHILCAWRWRRGGPQSEDDTAAAPPTGSGRGKGRLWGQIVFHSGLGHAFAEQPFAR